MNKSSGTAKLGVVLSIIAILLALFSLMSCSEMVNNPDKKDKTSTIRQDYNAEKTGYKMLIKGDAIFYTIGSTEHNINGMKYVVFQTTKGNIAVVNTTLDSMQADKIARDQIVKEQMFRESQLTSKLLESR